MKGLWDIRTDWGQVRSRGWNLGWSAWRKVDPEASQSAQETWLEAVARPLTAPSAAALAPIGTDQAVFPLE